MPSMPAILTISSREYLLAMYSINKDAVIRKSLIEDILYLNNYSTVEMLMLQLKTTDQTVKSLPLCHHNLNYGYDNKLLLLLGVLV